MASPWTILGLEPGQRDERSIKRAYARLLKQHRPDQDPEGFRRVHDAYQRALRMAEDDDDARRRLPPLAEQARVEAPPSTTSVTELSAKFAAESMESPKRPALTDEAQVPVADGRADEGDTAPAMASVHAMEPPARPALTNYDVVPKPQVIPPESVAHAPARVPQPIVLLTPPTGWEEALADLQRVVTQSGSPLRAEALLAVLRRLTGLVTQRLGDAAELASLLNLYLPDGWTQWRLVFNDDDLLAEMRCGQSELTAHTLRGCFECGDWVRLRQFASRWLEEDADTLDSGDAVALTRALAVWLAPFDYVLADQLVGRLPLAMRRNADNELDTLLAVGRDAASLPEDSRLYLCHLLVGRTPPNDEDLRWRTGGLLSQVPLDSLLRRMLSEEAREHFAGLATPAGTSGSITMFSVIVWIAGFCGWFFLWGGLCQLMIYVLDPGLAKALGILSLFALAVVAYFGVRRVHRRFSPVYEKRWRPWIWRYFGPFDLPLLFLVVYGWLGLGSVWIGLDSVVFARSAANPGMGLAWLLLAPLGLIVAAHHVRGVMRSYPQFLPPWQDIPVRIARVRRLFVLDSSSIQQGLQNDRQMLAAVLAVCPAVAGAVVLIGGLALYPGWSWDDNLGWGVPLLVWSGPAALTIVALYAWWCRWWEHGRQPRWWPLLLLGGCFLIPGFTWLVALGPVWFGWRNEPINGWLTLVALWFIADVTYRVWLRLGRRLPTI